MTVSLSLLLSMTVATLRKHGTVTPPPPLPRPHLPRARFILPSTGLAPPSPASWASWRT
ncbi:hypothetical protein ACFWBB_01805 [Streptomyces sp. NPDC060000]|uniref:hypothetical protein n=1 Tax=Streptomyces sp. NPDC060000 TaxID=3347031 RepID=UPI0036B4623C